MNSAGRRMEFWKVAKERFQDKAGGFGGDLQGDIGVSLRSFLDLYKTQESKEETKKEGIEEEEEDEDDEDEEEGESAEESDSGEGEEEEEEVEEKEEEGEGEREQKDVTDAYHTELGQDGRIKLRFLASMKHWVKSRKENTRDQKGRNQYLRSWGTRFDQIDPKDLRKQGFQTLYQPGKSSSQNAMMDLIKVDPLNIVIMVVGTRGDVQPFVALGRKLKESGHRVRLATHAVYRDFVETFGLEFYPLGGDPALLAEYVARNKGILPNHVVGLNKEIKENLEQIKQILYSTYKACTEADPECQNKEPFDTQVIISNPPTYGHIHCAEKLGVHLHMMFTMPWKETKTFAHPMARLGGVDLVAGAETSVGVFMTKQQRRRVRRKLNKFSYYAIERLTWSGFGDIINEFRETELGLAPLSQTEGPRSLEERDPPWTYCWSPALVPQPEDWPDHIDVVGFFFLNQSKVMDYKPPEDLQDFLDDGDPPIYIGFGSMPVMDPLRITDAIYKAVRSTGTRVILSKGAKKKGQEYFLGEGVEDKPDEVFVVGPVPHDWLFQHCSGVVHHGGAGTTAAGLIAGCPTLVVPFFGDQPFWGQRVYKAGVGPHPCPVGQLSQDVLEKAFDFFRRPQVIKNAQRISESIQNEDGLANAVYSFHRNLPDELAVFTQ